MHFFFVHRIKRSGYYCLVYDVVCTHQTRQHIGALTKYFQLYLSLRISVSLMSNTYNGTPSEKLDSFTSISFLLKLVVPVHYSPAF